MAEHVAEALGNAVLDLLQSALRGTRPTAHTVIDWLRTAAKPPPRVVLRAEDGSLYTGFAVFEKSHPVLMLAIRHEVYERPPIVTPPPSPFSPPPSYDHESRWREGDDVPFYRR